MNFVPMEECHFCPTPISKGIICKSCRQKMRTPKWLVQLLGDIFTDDGFGVDVAASKENAVAPKYYTEDNSGLEQVWVKADGVHFCNPPFVQAEDWVAKAQHSWLLNRTPTVLVLPVGCSQTWYHRHVLERAYVAHPNKRINFDYPDGTPSDRADRDTMIVAYGPWGKTVQSMDVRSYLEALSAKET